MEFFDSGPGLAFLHCFVRAFHVGCVKIGACGLRLVCLWLEMTGLHRFVGVSFGTQQQIKRGMEAAMVAYTRTETPPMAQHMLPQETSGTLDLTQPVSSAATSSSVQVRMWKVARVILR